MYIGHFGVAFAAKRLAPRTSLATLFAAAEFLDLLWPVLLLTGVEHVRIVPGITKVSPLDYYHYPISHSLLLVCVWAVLFAAGYWIVCRYWRGAWVMSALVLSHWVLDAIVHRPDLPLSPGYLPMVGFGLWNHRVASIALELILFGVGLLIYLRTTVAFDRIGNGSLLGLVTFLLVTWMANIFGPHPPSVRAIAIVGVTAILFVPWGAWIDHHRSRRKRIESEDRLFTEKHIGI